eukprot:scaffold135451_cov32-Tisochrysis_lutea.AAC.3
MKTPKLHMGRWWPKATHAPPPSQHALPLALGKACHRNNHHLNWSQHGLVCRVSAYHANANERQRPLGGGCPHGRRAH